MLASVWLLVHVLSDRLPIQLLSCALEQAEEDGPTTWAPAIYVGDSDEVLGLAPGSDLVQHWPWSASAG